MKARLAASVVVLMFLTRLVLAAPDQQIDPTKEAGIRHLMELTGAAQVGHDVMTQMAEQLKPLLLKSLPPGDRSQQIVNVFMQRMTAQAKTKELVDAMVPIYDRYLTQEDVKGLTQFYESPLGKKMIKVLPDITQEGYKVGAEWGQKIAKEVLEQMKEEYPELKGKQ